ncbi:MAG TPA: NlpC/P60 family protein [Acidimicrobiales bacterium]|nr:NlpC/P60 family protein [Acidimicrobiales bacterium]
MAPEREIADKKAEAARIERELQAQGRQVSILAEELNESRLVADRLAGEVAATEAQLRETVQRMDAARARLKLRAVTAYMRGGHVPSVGLVAQGPAAEIGLRRAYVGALVGQDRGAVDDLEAAREERATRQGQLQGAQQSAREALADVEARRRAAAQAAAARRATLEAVQGELADLVAAEARRRAEEEAQRARALLAAREAAAREAARRAEQEAARRAEAAREEAARRAEAAREEAARRPAPRTPPAVAPAPAPAIVPRTSPSGGAAAGAETAVAEAKRQLGKPYEWGASGPDSFDCSGLTSWAWRAGGKSLPHSSRAQYSATARVPADEIRIGDLIFYGEPIHHVGIYAGDGRMVEASETGTPVRMASIYRSDLVGVGRVQ